MGLVDVFKSELDRQRDLKKEEEEKLQTWMNTVQEALIGMRQSYDKNLGRSARGDSVTSDMDALEYEVAQYANALEKLIARPEADKAEDEFIEKIEAVCEQAREVSDAAALGPKYAASPGRKLEEKIESALEQIE